MLRMIIGTVTTLLGGVGLLLPSIQARFAVILAWILLLCGLVLLLDMLPKALQHWHPAHRIYNRSIKKRKDEAVGAIDKMRRLPSSTFFTSIDYDPRNKVITAEVGIKKRYRRAVNVVLWLANHRMLPQWLTIAAAERLGWKCRSQST